MLLSIVGNWLFCNSFWLINNNLILFYQDAIICSSVDPKPPRNWKGRKGGSTSQRNSKNSSGLIPAVVCKKSHLKKQLTSRRTTERLLTGRTSQDKSRLKLAKTMLSFSKVYLRLLGRISDKSYGREMASEQALESWTSNLLLIPRRFRNCRTQGGNPRLILRFIKSLQLIELSEEHQF